MLIDGFNSYSVDWDNNYLTFLTAQSDSKGLNSLWLYSNLAVLAKSFGIDYVLFNGILASVSTLLIAYVIFKVSKRPTVVISLMFIYPFIDDIIQKRWYYAMGILIFGVYKSLNLKNKWFQFIGLFVTALIACQFHTGAIIFFTLPFYFLFSRKVQNFITIIIIIAGTVGRNYISILLNAITGDSLAEKSELYFVTFASSSSVVHYMFWLIWHLIQAGMVFLLYKYVTNSKDDYKIWRLNVWSMCIIPLYSFDPVFSRIFRVILVFNYISISNSLWADGKMLNKKGILILMSQIALSLISLFVFDINSALGVQFMIYDIFKYNNFMNWL